jgi:8-oxo-dGTP pyrophosphatase MutT (NUDIX family)
MKPILLKLQDKQYSFQGISHVRPNARALLENAEGLFAFHHIYLKDKFGQRDYLETPGGGLEGGETPEQAVVREVEEETGFKSKVILPIGLIEDDYNLIQRHNQNYYFYVKVTGRGQLHQTEQERKMIQQLHWLSLQDAKAWYGRLSQTGISQLIQQRELPIVEWLITYRRSLGLK